MRKPSSSFCIINENVSHRQNEAPFWKKKSIGVVQERRKGIEEQRIVVWTKGFLIGTTNANILLRFHVQRITQTSKNVCLAMGPS